MDDFANLNLFTTYLLPTYYRARGRLVVNGALDFERLEDMQRGDVMHGVSLEDEPFHGLCCRARQGRIIQRHDAIRDLLANTLNALEEVTVVSTEPTLDGEGGHGQRGDIKLLANGTEFVIDVTVACPATRHMTRTHHTGTVPGAAGGYAQACKRRKYWTRLQPFVIETGGRVHRDTLQFVHDKLVNAPVGVEAREKNRIAIVADICENRGMLGATPHQMYGEFDQGAREAAAKKGTGETAWAPGACWAPRA